MANILVFAISVVIYFFIRGQYCRSGKKAVREMGIAALLLLPLNINGNVFTVLGSGYSDKGIYSLFSVYQKAEGDAVSILGAFVQFAGNNASTALGIVVWQEANNKAIIGIGLNSYQKSDKKDAGGFLLISGYQESKEDNVINVIGVTGYQKAGKTATMLCCLVGRQDADTAGIVAGLAGYQNATKLAETYISVALLQRAGTRERSFAIWSQLRGD